jgi:hypothetical protein
MFKTLTIGGKDVALAANAATPFRFKQVFKKDLFYVLGDEKRAEENGVETVMQLAFIMAKQAEKTDMNQLNEDGFVNWLEGLEPMAFVDSAEDILNAYMENTVSTSTP